MEKVDTIVVDKPGTLPQGRPEVTGIETCGGWNKNDVFTLAAAVEAQSKQPLSQAVIRQSKADKLQTVEASEFNSVSGGGVRARVDDHDHSDR